MRCTDPERRPVPRHADGERSDAGCTAAPSSGAPRGAGNGMWKLRSTEVIGRRQKMTAEMRELRRLMRILDEEQRRLLELVE